uniref:EGF-like domain-containing protein n=1 Tax=Trichuris muris TaxID=70415 RepID=A0A5S6QMT7_TRIMR
MPVVFEQQFERLVRRERKTIVCNSMYGGRIRAIRTEETRGSKLVHEFRVPSELYSIVSAHEPTFYNGIRLVAIVDVTNSSQKRTMQLLLRDAHYNDTYLSLNNVLGYWSPKNAFGLSETQFQNIFENKYSLPACLVMHARDNTFEVEEISNCDAHVSQVLCETNDLVGCTTTSEKDKDGWIMCKCQPDYYGRFCQFYEASETDKKDEQKLLIIIMLGIFGSFLFLFCCFAILIRRRLIRKRQRRRERMKKMLQKRRRSSRGLELLSAFGSQFSTMMRR